MTESRSKAEVSTLVAPASAGDRSANDRLFRVAYDELRALAHHLVRTQPDGHTLQPTSLVHAVYLRLVDHEATSWDGRSHFFAVAAKAMRHILIDYVRAQATGKRGAGWEKVPLDSAIQAIGATEADFLTVGEVLEQLAELDERRAQVVELRFFAGLSVEETARVLGVSKTTVESDWRFARAWLSKALTAEDRS